MTDRILRLVHSVAQIAQVADDLGQRFADELDVVLRDTERHLRPLIDDVSRGHPTAVVKAARAARTRREIRDVLKAAGYDELADQATGQPLDDIVREVLATRRLADSSAALNATAAQRIEALKALQMTDLLDEGDSIARALWQATIRGVFGSRPIDDILTDLGDVLTQTQPQIRTLYDTSVSIFGRQVEALQAGDDPETAFAYMGPADTKNRPFCRARVGKVYTRAEIDQMDNGQLDNPFLTAGGYNCRHQWVEVSKFSALRDLVGTDQRIPEVAQQLAHLKEAA